VGLAGDRVQVVEMLAELLLDALDAEEREDQAGGEVRKVTYPRASARAAGTRREHGLD